MAEGTVDPLRVLCQVFELPGVVKVAWAFLLPGDRFGLVLEGSGSVSAEQVGQCFWDAHTCSVSPEVLRSSVKCRVCRCMCRSYV
jgi:hypothetical protein